MPFTSAINISLKIGFGSSRLMMLRFRLPSSGIPDSTNRRFVSKRDISSQSAAVRCRKSRCVVIAIAVLLEYHRWAQPRSGQQKKAKQSAPAQPAQASLNRDSSSVLSPASTTDLKLGEVMVFVEWLQSAIKALERGQPLPDSPKLGGDLALWIQTIRESGGTPPMRAKKCGSTWSPTCGPEKLMSAD